MVAVEAMAAGTAPVASAHGAFPELVTHGSDGALFPADRRRCSGRHPRPTSTTTRSGGTDTAQQARQTYLSRFSPDAEHRAAAGDLPLRD